MKTDFFHPKMSLNPENTEVLLFDSHEEFEKEAVPKIVDAGFFMQTKNNYTRGDKLKVRICFEEIPDGIPIDCRVAWVRRPSDWNVSQSVGVGFVVDGKDNKQWQYLLKYINLSGAPSPVIAGHGSYLSNNGMANQTRQNDANDAMNEVRRQDSDEAILSLIKMIQVKQQVTVQDISAQDVGRDTKQFIRRF